MPSFPSFTLTASGQDMQAQAEAGGTLIFSRIAMGAGAAATPATATDLVDQRLTADVQSITNMGDGSVRVRAVFANAGLLTAFAMSEVGVFAEDPTTHAERLHSYTKTTTPDYMPADGGSTLVEQIFDAIIAIGSAASVTAVIDDQVMIATKEDVKFPTNHDDLQYNGNTVIMTTRQKLGEEYIDRFKIMGFGGVAIPIAVGAINTPPAGWAYLYARTNGLASPNARFLVCVKLPDGNDVVLCAGDPS